MRETPLTLVLVLLLGIEVEEPILEAVQPLLKELQHVMTNSLLVRLPPLSDIPHTTDFILRLTLPNQLAYKMLPT